MRTGDVQFHRRLVEDRDTCGKNLHEAVVAGNSVDAKHWSSTVESTASTVRMLEQPFAEQPDIYGALRQSLPETWMPLAAELDQLWDDFGPDTEFAVDVGLGAVLYYRGPVRDLIYDVRRGRPVLLSAMPGGAFDPRRVYLPFSRLGTISQMRPGELPDEGEAPHAY